MSESKYKWPLNNAELAELLGLRESYIRRLKQEMNCVESVDFYRLKPSSMILWKEAGAVKLAQRTTQPKAKTFLESLSEDVRHKKASDEGRTLDIICAALHKLCRIHRKFRVGGYYIDLYSPELKIAVECDELGHITYSKRKEAARQEWIEEHLGCQFIRYNPANPTAVGKVIYDLFSAIEAARAA